MNDPYRTITPSPGDPKSTADYHDPDAPPLDLDSYLPMLYTLIPTPIPTPIAVPPVAGE